MAALSNKHALHVVRYMRLHTIPLQMMLPFDDIPKSINKKMKRSEKYMKSLNVQIQKIAPNSKNENNDNLKQCLSVGSLYQYPQLSHFNECLILEIFGKTKIPKHSWTFDQRIQQNYGIQMQTALDYYPFNSSKKEFWKIRKNRMNIKRSDLLDDKLPKLTRNGQELVVFRDIPYDMSGLYKSKAFIKHYKPDVVIFEFGKIPFFDKFMDENNSLKYIKMPIQTLLAYAFPFKLMHRSLGKAMFNATKYFFKYEIASYSFEGALDACQKYKTPIIAGDVYHKISDTLRVFNDYLDLYNIATLFHYGLIDDKFMNASILTNLGEQIAQIIQFRLYPHKTAMNVYRNDVLSAVINEIESEKILLISQTMRLSDLFDKLTGKQSINYNWIQSMDDNHVFLQKCNSFEYKQSTIHSKNTYIFNNIQSEFDENIARCCSYLGFQNTAFLLVEWPFSQYSLSNGSKKQSQKMLIDQLKQEIDEIASDLKTKYDKS